MVETRRHVAVRLYKLTHTTKTHTTNSRTYLTLRTRGIWISDYQYVVKIKRQNFEISKDHQDLQIQLLSPKGKVPTRGTSDIAGYNLYCSKTITLPLHTWVLVSTDIAIQVSSGTYGRIAPRSGLVAKLSIDLSTGVIDADYRGTVKVLLVNHSNEEFQVTTGDRIAQLIL